MTLEEDLERMKKQERTLDAEMRDIARNATMRAIEAAQDATPPNGPRGAHTATGELSAHWATDSVTEPEASGGTYKTVIANSMQYASYVNDGHRMDKHFVPGIVAIGGMISRNPDGTGGMMVGTQTEYVPGLHMTDKAEETYKDAVDAMAEELMRKLEG